MPLGTPVTLFVCGDVMTGRGIDQILPHSNAPGIQEPCVSDAREYVELAAHVNGSIPSPVDTAYIWGDALGELERMRPDVRVINLETSVTRHHEYWPEKGIHYRMHPENVGCLTSARIDVCTLANNHVLDYGYGGLEETLQTLRAARLNVAGAGTNLEDAQRPAMEHLAEDRRVVMFSIGLGDSGIPPAWAAGADSPGVDLLPDLSEATADAVLDRVRRVKRAGDVVVTSIHWGSNWGYDIPAAQIAFAHRLLDGEVDLIHGHSSHHPRPIEVYRDKLVLYGCGDFINDYEGIGGHEEYRDDLALMYFPRVNPATGHLLTLQMAPMRRRRMQLAHASRVESDWLLNRLALTSRAFASDFDLTDDGRLMLHTRMTSHA
jgi:poly-gamma-glutamate capsule biosynthesis protein CapA/YwtB (metallophosphatase superfamily)